MTILAFRSALGLASASSGGASGYPTIRQEAAGGSSPLTSTTNVQALPGAALAGNLLVMALAGDKNTGTVTMSDNGDSLGWTVEVSMPSASVSLYVCWKVADGGETTMTATTSGAPGTGNTWYGAELEQTGSAAWSVVAKASTLTNETAVGSVSTGTTGAATYNGLALAVAAVDSQNTLTGTLSWSNGYTVENTPVNPAGSGGGNAGAYVAIKNVDAATTTNSTFASTAGTDQLSAAVVVFGRAGSGSGTAVPVVDAGADVASHTVSTAFSRTATETNSPTSRAWTVVSGPAQVGDTLATTAALSWTPTVAGTYVLRFSATNAGGTGTNDMTIVVVSAGGGGPSTTTTIVQSSSVVTLGISTQSCVLPFAPNADALVFTVLAGNKQVDTMVPPASFTERIETVGPSVSGAAADARGVNGGSWSWTTAAAENNVMLGVFETNQLGSWAYRSSITVTDDLVVTTRTATLGNAPKAGVVFAIVGVDSSWSGTTGGSVWPTGSEPTFGAGWTVVGVFQGATAAANPGGAAFALAFKDVAEGESTSCTATWTNGDQAYMQLVQYDKAEVVVVTTKTGQFFPFLAA